MKPFPHASCLRGEGGNHNFASSQRPDGRRAELIALLCSAIMWSSRRRRPFEWVESELLPGQLGKQGKVRIDMQLPS